MTTTTAARPQQFEFLVRITLRDGGHGTHQGFYACGADAVLRAMQWFEPKRISAVRVKPQTVLNPVTSPVTHPASPTHFIRSHA